jgi:osmotically-inducible protein OsmY
MIAVLGSGFAMAQTMPQQQPSQGSSSPQTQSPSSTDQQPSTAPDQGKNPSNTPETLPNTDQNKGQSDTKGQSDQKMPQSDAAPSATGTGDVQNTIQSAIQKDPTLSTANVTVEVKNGKAVELSGTVPSKDAKDTAERIAKENAGGMKVKNHLKVASTSHDQGASPNPKGDASNPK